MPHGVYFFFRVGNNAYNETSTRKDNMFTITLLGAAVFMLVFIGLLALEDWSFNRRITKQEEAHSMLHALLGPKSKK